MLCNWSPTYFYLLEEVTWQVMDVAHLIEFWVNSYRFQLYFLNFQSEVVTYVRRCCNSSELHLMAHALDELVSTQFVDSSYVWMWDRVCWCFEACGVFDKDGTVVWLDHVCMRMCCCYIWWHDSETGEYWILSSSKWSLTSYTHTISYTV